MVRIDGSAERPVTIEQLIEGRLELYRLALFCCHVDIDFESELINDEHCHVWAGCINEKGYGKFWDGRNVYAHRWIVAYVDGEVSADEEIHHLCMRPSCVNYAHLMRLPYEEHTYEHTPTHLRVVQ